MAGRITDADKERVRDANRIEAVVGDYVTLRPGGGGNLKGLCPFHDEKTPSFNVRPSHGTYHCFGCGEGGDVFEFIATMEHLTFVEAVERLADRVGITLTKVEGGTVNRTEPGTRQRLMAANKAAAAFYAEQLTTPEAQPARDFLAERGFDLQAAQSFGCGYAPAGWDRLTKALLAQGFSLPELYKAGLARQGQRGPIDQFHRRLLWSIRDTAGDVVGFGARRLFDDDRIEAKYVNTAETPVYHKSRVLYGLDLAKRQIAKQRRAVVVEGYTDVMAMHLAGVTTAVASCGTAFGDEHISVLRRFLLDAAPARPGAETIRGEVIYTFDGDAAGQKAALKAFDSDQKFVANTYVAIAPDGMDPCDLRQAKGDAAVRALVDSRDNLFAFAIHTTLADYDLDTPEGRVAAKNATVPLVARIKQGDLREEYARELAGWLGAEPRDIVDLVRRRVREDQAEQRRAEQRRAEALRPTDRNGAAGRNGPAGRAEQPGRAEQTGRPEQSGRGERPAGPGTPSAGRPGGPGGSASSGSVDDRPAGAEKGSGPARPNPTDPRTSAEREMLKLVLQQPEMVSVDYPHVRPDTFTHPAYLGVHQAVLAAGGPPARAAGPSWIGEVAEHVPPGTLRSLITELSVEPPRSSSGEPNAEYAGMMLARMLERGAALDEARLRSALKRAESTGRRDQAAALQADLLAVSAYRRALADRARGESS